MYNKFETLDDVPQGARDSRTRRKERLAAIRERRPEVYEKKKEELDTLFAKCDAKERLWFEFFLMTGMREQEVIALFMGGVNLSRTRRSLCVTSQSTVWPERITVNARLLYLQSSRSRA